MSAENSMAPGTEASAAEASTASTGSEVKKAPRILYTRPKALTDTVSSYCPGCTHGIIQRLVAEVLDGLGIEGNTIGVCPMGCSVTAYDFYGCDMAQAAHGRAPAVATGIKRARPDSVVFTYQGDGDLASIGMAETIHAAARGEHITSIFVNNAIYGMTGGQMAPTSLPGQVTQTSPYGRDVAVAGYPLRICELLSGLEGVALAERVTVDNPKNVRAAKRAIRRGFEYQLEGLGYSIIEVISTCPTNWGMTPQQALGWLQDNMLPYYPLGVYKDVKAAAAEAALASAATSTLGAVASLAAATPSPNEEG